MRLSEFGLMEKVLKDPRLMLTSPQEYQNFISLIQGARGLVTDSGGIADETTYFGIPCLTLRPHVERAITMQLGTNDIVPLEPGSLLKKANDLLDGKWKKGQIPPYWDGKAAERICERILSSC